MWYSDRMVEQANQRFEEWHANERELEHLRDLPVGEVDPVAREAAIYRR